MGGLQPEADPWWDMAAATSGRAPQAQSAITFSPAEPSRLRAYRANRLIVRMQSRTAEALVTVGSISDYRLRVERGLMPKLDSHATGVVEAWVKAGRVDRLRGHEVDRLDRAAARHAMKGAATLGRRMRWLAGELAILILAASAGAFSVSLLFAPPARANHDCPSDNQIRAKPDTNGRGLRVGGPDPGMWVQNTDIDCARASSIGVVNSSSTRFVELGWYEEPINVTPCPQTSGPPRILVAKLFDGVFTCDNQPEFNPANLPRWDEFKVQDQNQDGDWYYYRNGNFLGFYGLGTFVTGSGRASSERKTSHHDSMFGSFYGLDRMNASQAWVNWNGTVQIEDSDGDYRLCIFADDRLQMQSSPCS
jgi:hypothetical protein